VKKKKQQRQNSRHKLPKIMKIGKNQKIGIVIIFVLVIVLVLVFNKEKNQNGGNGGSGNGGVNCSNAFTKVNSSKRGIQNNNWGNIKFANNNWDGKVSRSCNTDTNKTFEQFYEKKYGDRAMIKLVNNYIIAGHNTLRKILSRWVGNNTTETASYINFAKSKGYNDYTLNLPQLATKQNLFEICKLITQKETSSTISSSDFNTAYALL
jgi:hypothetical protein